MNPQLQNILMQDAIIVQQAIEMANVIVNIDTANNYDLFATTGHKLGTVSEVGGGAGGFILRQLFNNARACTLHIADDFNSIVWTPTATEQFSLPTETITRLYAEKRAKTNGSASGEQ